MRNRILDIAIILLLITDISWMAHDAYSKKQDIRETKETINFFFDEFKKDMNELNSSNDPMGKDSRNRNPVDRKSDQI